MQLVEHLPKEKVAHKHLCFFCTLGAHGRQLEERYRTTLALDRESSQTSPALETTRQVQAMFRPPGVGRVAMLILMRATSQPRN